MTTHRDNSPTGQQANDQNQTTGDLMPMLLKHAHERENAPEQSKQRIKHQLKVQWQQKVKQRKQQRLWFGVGSIAAAMSVFLLVMNINLLPESKPQSLVFLESIQGQVNSNNRLIEQNGSVKKQSQSTVLAMGTMIETLDSGYATLVLQTGGNLRIKNNSQLVINGNNEFTLSYGAVYFESDLTAENKSPISITTLYGTIQDIGTQFEVSTEKSTLQINVREGLVNLTQAQTQEEVSVVAGNQLNINELGESQTLKISSHDPQWQWVNKIAPKFMLENKSLYEFLNWVAREYGLNLSFDSEHNKKLSQMLILHGDIDGLTLSQALTTVLSTTEFGYELQDNQLTVHRKNVSY